MNAKKAKALRKKIYGDQSLRQPREYMPTNHRQVLGRDDKGATIIRTSVTLVNAPGSLRAKYQAAKKLEVVHG